MAIKTMITNNNFTVGYLLSG